jgi:NTP pyrophosphatase (non-canonical NTP hydrolase)
VAPKPKKNKLKASERKIHLSPETGKYFVRPELIQSVTNIGILRNLWEGYPIKELDFDNPVLKKNVAHLKSEIDEVLAAIENKDAENFYEELMDILMIAAGIVGCTAEDQKASKIVEFTIRKNINKNIKRIEEITKVE